VVGAAQQRLHSAELKLADARKSPHAGYDLHKLEADVVEAQRLLVVAKRRAEADAAVRTDKARLEAELAEGR
jgi:hypothetical protein